MDEPRVRRSGDLFRQAVDELRERAKARATATEVVDQPIEALHGGGATVTRDESRQPRYALQGHELPRVEVEE